MEIYTVSDLLAAPAWQLSSWLTNESVEDLYAFRSTLDRWQRVGAPKDEVARLEAATTEAIASLEQLTIDQESATPPPGVGTTPLHIAQPGAVVWVLHHDRWEPYHGDRPRTVAATAGAALGIARDGTAFYSGDWVAIQDAQRVTYYRLGDSLEQRRAS